MTLDQLPEESRAALLASTLEMCRSPSGRQVIFYILALTHQYRSSHDSLNGLSAAFAEGERNVGLKVIDLLEQTDPTLYPLMLLAEAQAVIQPKDVTNEA